jgi:hypothetical protein
MARRRETCHGTTPDGLSGGRLAASSGPRGPTRLPRRPTRLMDGLSALEFMRPTAARTLLLFADPVSSVRHRRQDRSSSIHMKGGRPPTVIAPPRSSGWKRALVHDTPRSVRARIRDGYPPPRQASCFGARSTQVRWRRRFSCRYSHRRRSSDLTGKRSRPPTVSPTPSRPFTNRFLSSCTRVPALSAGTAAHCGLFVLEGGPCAECTARFGRAPGPRQVSQEENEHGSGGTCFLLDVGRFVPQR